MEFPRRTNRHLTCRSRRRRCRKLLILAEIVWRRLDIDDVVATSRPAFARRGPNFAQYFPRTIQRTLNAATPNIFYFFADCESEFEVFRFSCPS